MSMVQATEKPLLIGDSAQMHDLRANALRAAGAPVKVLITGESGVGKDLAARFIHAHSPRASRPMIAVNCAGLTETLLESELFGHVRGSFTGAHRDKQGKLQLAHGSTIFLDEVGEMSLRMQVLLLRFLENGEVHPVGSEAVGASVDVRVIAATNRDLRAMVAAGLFREDLFYRLNVVHLVVPPLRERPEDIRPIIDFLCARADRPVRFTPEAMAALERHRWAGNVRELQNVLEQLMWMRTGDVLGLDDLPAHIQPAAIVRARPSRERRRQTADDLFDALKGGRLQFWDDVYRLFMSRDLTRHDLRELVRRGLAASGGSYRGMLALFGIPSSDYKRVLNFLSSHACTVDYREFRTQRAESDFPSMPAGEADAPLALVAPRAADALVS
jgi:transcriptional regulator with PAS, ATPase and Fis domain